MQAGGGTQSTLKDFSYTPRSVRLDQFTPRSPTSDVEFFQQRHKLVDNTTANGAIISVVIIMSPPLTGGGH